MAQQKTGKNSKKRTAKGGATTSAKGKKTAKSSRKVSPNTASAKDIRGGKSRTSSSSGTVSSTKRKKTLPAPKDPPSGLSKRFLKSRPSCKVTFRLPAQAAPDAQKVSILGDFNNWNGKATVMKRLKNGSFTATVELQCGHEYRFRYLIDGQRWENDWKADAYVPNNYGCDDSVVSV